MALLLQESLGSLFNFTRTWLSPSKIYKTCHSVISQPARCANSLNSLAARTIFSVYWPARVTWAARRFADKRSRDVEILKGCDWLDGLVKAAKLWHLFLKNFFLTQLTNKKSVWSVTYVAQWWSLKKMMLVNNFFKKLEETET